MSDQGKGPPPGVIAQFGNGIHVNYHDRGHGDPLLLIHGSGPGVDAWSNWRTVIPVLESEFRIIAPDMIGFGQSCAPDIRFDIGAWVGQLVSLLDHLGIDRVAVAGNSFGGSIALHLAERAPTRVSKIVLMGPVGHTFELSEGLELVWGYEPSRANMDRLIREVFVHDSTFVTDDLVDLRYEASIRPGTHERFASIFPSPRQRWIDALALSSDRLARIQNAVLVVHGANDKVIPVAASNDLVEALPRASIVVFNDCGHWVQIEHCTEFCEVLLRFLKEDQDP